MKNDREIEIPKQDIASGDIVLRNFINLSAAETEDVLRMRNDPFVREWLFNDRIIEAAEHRAFLAGLKTDVHNCYFLAKRKETGLGVISLNNIDGGNRHAYLGIYRNPFCQEKGLGSVLMERLIELAFRVLGLHTLKLEVFFTNKRAISLYLKFGFQQEGLLREFIYRDGAWMDVVVMGLVNREPKE